MIDYKAYFFIVVLIYCLFFKTKKKRAFRRSLSLYWRKTFFLFIFIFSFFHFVKNSWEKKHFKRENALTSTSDVATCSAEKIFSSSYIIDFDLSHAFHSYFPYDNIHEKFFDQIVKAFIEFFFFFFFFSFTLLQYIYIYMYRQTKEKEEELFQIC